jgi:glycerol-1-phosphate dehydrogenase [NAD(P)+]
MVMTNNSASSPSAYAEKLKTLGFDCSKKMVVNSTTATINYINQNYKGKRVYLVGTKKMKTQLLDSNINLVEDKPEIVLIGNDQELTTAKLVKACKFLQDGAIFLGTNPDFALPLKDGYYTSDCGSICKMIELTINRSPKFIGKPNKSMLSFIKDGNTIVIGDRLYTDIQLAINNDFDSLLVLSGEAKIIDIKKTQVFPTYVLDSVNNLN